MADGINIRVEGVNEIKSLFDEIGFEFNSSTMVQILRPAGREIVKASRNFVPQTGEIKRATKRDIGIVKARVVGKDAEVNVGLMFKLYDINDQVQKVAPIVLHTTEGFRQTDRTGDKSWTTGTRRHSRGRVEKRTGDFIEDGFKASATAQMSAINKGIDDKISKLKIKHGI